MKIFRLARREERYKQHKDVVCYSYFLLIMDDNNLLNERFIYTSLDTESPLDTKLHDRIAKSKFSESLKEFTDSNTVTLPETVDRNRPTKRRHTYS
jgi:hypothetical protein